MQTTLIPIFQIRELCLQKLNPILFQKEYKIIHNSALAAQDYILSGAFKEYNPRMGLSFKRLPGYIAVHKKYNLPYSPDASIRESIQLNPGLVMDLAYAFNQDITNGIIDAHGNIRKPEALGQSEVMSVYHNQATHGEPAIAFRLMTPSQITQMLRHTTQAHTR